MLITDHHREEFKLKGWTTVDCGITPKKLAYYRDSLKSLYDKAKKINYPLGRSYYPHLTNINLVAIESPFNEAIINDGIKELFSYLSLGQAISDLLKWKEILMVYAKLFTIPGQKYKYQGHWHRDGAGDLENIKKSYNFLDISMVQCIIYTDDNPGFRLLKPDFDISGNHPKKLNHNPSYSNLLPLNLPSEFYDVMPGKAGTVIFFNPRILHQGFTCTNRSELLLQFVRSNADATECRSSRSFTSNDDFVENDFLDFNVLNEYSEHFNPFKVIDAPVLYEQKGSFKTKAYNSFSYYIPVINFLKYFYMKIKNKSKFPFTPNIFANSQFQNRI